MAAPPDQPSLFDAPFPRRLLPGDPAIAAAMRLVRRIKATTDLIDRATLLGELEAIARQAFEESVAGAHDTGRSWRAIAAHLGVPHQTLHRRIAGSRGGEIGNP